MSEVRRAILRIASNYARLIGSVVMGLLIIRFLLRAVGADGVGLVSLLASTMGLATVIEESVENSMVRELGRAHHGGNDGEFRRIYNSALAVSGGAAVCALGMYAIIACILPLLSIHQDLMGAAYWFLAAKCIESMVVIACSPAYNMYLVRERMAAVNAWMLARRGCGLVAAIAALALNFQSPASGLIAYGWIAAGLHVLVVLIAVGLNISRDRRLWPSPRLVDRVACREIVRTSGANSAMYASQLLQLPACSVLMNLAFGLYGNLVFGFAVQMAGYVRMMSNGVVGGIEAVSARLASNDQQQGETVRFKALTYHATRLQAFIAIPAAAGMFVIAPSFLRVWVAGEGVGEQALVDASLLARVLVFGILAQCLLDVWWRVLYGAGFVSAFARPFAVSAGATAPLAALMLAVLPPSVELPGPALAYSVLNVLLALGVMPWIVAQCTSVTVGHLMMVIVRPALPALVAAVVAMTIARYSENQGLTTLLITGGAFTMAFTALAYPLALEARDRQRLTSTSQRLRALLVRSAGVERDQSSL